jgi:hypothetical protein
MNDDTHFFTNRSSGEIDSIYCVFIDQVNPILFLSSACKEIAENINSKKSIIIEIDLDRFINRAVEDIDSKYAGQDLSHLLYSSFRRIEMMYDLLSAMDILFEVRIFGESVSQSKMPKECPWIKIISTGA